MDKGRKQKIYHFFDEYGIKGNNKFSQSFEIDKFEGTIEKKDPLFYFSPDLSRFKLTEEETEEIIKDYVYDTTNVRINYVNELTSMRSINGKPFFLQLNDIHDGGLKYCLAFGRVPGSITFRENDGIDTLGEIVEIKGDLGFSDSSISNLSVLKKVQGDFWIVQYNTISKIETLSNLEYVGGNLNLKHSYVTDLGNLEYVGGNLNLRGTLISSLGKLKVVGNNLLLPKRHKGHINLGNVSVHGKIKYYEDIKIPI